MSTLSPVLLGTEVTQPTSAPAQPVTGTQADSRSTPPVPQQQPAPTVHQQQPSPLVARRGQVTQLGQLPAADAGEVPSFRLATTAGMASARLAPSEELALLRTVAASGSLEALSEVSNGLLLLGMDSEQPNVNLHRVGQALTQGNQGMLHSEFVPYSNAIQLGQMPINDIVMWVMRETYMANLEDLAYYADKVRHFNAMKKAIRTQLAEWRRIQSDLAGIKDEDKGNTNLAGDPIEGSGSESTRGRPGGAPVVTSAADRADNPEMDDTIAHLMSYYAGAPFGNGTPLEDALRGGEGNPELRAKLIEAIPFMTTEELAKILHALGGADMVINGLDGLWEEIVDAMRDDQVVELGWIGKDLHNVVSGQLNRAWQARRDEALNRMERELGDAGMHASNPDAIVDAWRELQGSLDARANGTAVDQSAANAIAALEAINPDGTITAEQLVRLIEDATSDADARAASVEYEDLLAFIGGRELSAGAEQVWQRYVTEVDDAREAGRNGIPQSDWDLMINDIQEVAAQFAAEQVTPVGGETVELVNGSEDPGAIDTDPSDGVIDDIQVIDQPPYMIASGDRIETVAQLETAIENLEEKLSSVGDDAQLANVELQNMLQKQQHTLQAMSNMSKTIHDTMMAIIRKIGS